MAAQARQKRAEDVLGPLNPHEQKHAPEWLYLAGDENLLRAPAHVSIVGSRSASDAGLSRAAKLARLLVARGVVVVSGLARGIDTAAHRSAIEHGGRTIAVLGTPLDRYYPKEHKELQEQIAREHLVISQFPNGYPVRRANFPMRNRTMALISDVSVIVEAGESSGTHSQGWEALRLNRPLFIARSVVKNQQLSWPAAMLDYGAHVLTEVEEILDLLPLTSSPASVAF